MNEYSEGVWDGPEHKELNCPPLGKSKFCTKGEQVSRYGFWHKNRGRARQPRIPRDIYHCGGCGCESDFGGILWTIGSAAWGGMGGGRE